MSLKEEVDEILEKGMVNAHDIEAIAEYLEQLEATNDALKIDVQEKDAEIQDLEMQVDDLYAELRY